MDRLFQESPGGRRRFLDRLVPALHPGHAVHSARYEAAMRSRPKLLTADQPADHVWLNALEAQMAEHGAALELARWDKVAALGTEQGHTLDGTFGPPWIGSASVRERG